MAEDNRVAGDWLHAYMAYTKASLSPEKYHLWSAISIISSALQRKVFIPVTDTYVCYPNEYIVLIGPPGIAKSTAMRSGRHFIKKISSIAISTESVTREKLILTMGQKYKDGHSSMTVHSSEIATFLSSSKEDMVTFLIDIFDSQDIWEHDTKTGGKNTINSPCLNLLGATTPDSLKREIAVESSGIGLTSRILFVYANKMRKGRWRSLQINQENTIIAELLLNDLHRIHALKGEYILTDEADEFYNDWFQLWLEQPNPTGNPTLTPYFARKATHILKIAMCVAAAQRDELVINVTDIQRVMAMLESLEPEMADIFIGVGRNVLASPMQSVIAILDSQDGQATFQQLASMLKSEVRKDELTEILEMLQISGDIVRLNLNGEVGYALTGIDQD